MDLDKWYTENKHKKITVTMSYEEWTDVMGDVNTYLDQLKRESTSVNKLNDILDEFEKGIKEYEPSKISRNNILRTEQYEDGVNIYFKDGSQKFIENAVIVGNEFSYSFESK